jgi:hypothetical protein
LTATPATERPAWACQVHTAPRTHAWTPADRGYRTCAGCADRLRDTLREIALRYRALDPSPGGSGDTGGRGAPGFATRSPASDHVIAMLDPRSRPDARTWRGSDKRLHHEQERPPLSVWAVLYAIADHVNRARGITNNALACNGVDELTRYIDSHLDWLTRQPDIAVHAELIERLAGQLRPVTGEPARRCVGRCPNTVDEQTTTRECRARLFAPLHGDTITCRACGRSWPRPEWERLGLMLTG